MRRKLSHGGSVLDRSEITLLSNTVPAAPGNKFVLDRSEITLLSNSAFLN